MPNIKKNSQTLGLRGILIRRGNFSYLVVLKLTGTGRHITLCEYVSIDFCVEASYYSCYNSCFLNIAWTRAKGNDNTISCAAGSLSQHLM